MLLHYSSAFSAFQGYFFLLWTGAKTSPCWPTGGKLDAAHVLPPTHPVSPYLPRQVIFPKPIHSQGCGHIVLSILNGIASPAWSFSPPSFFHFEVAHPCCHSLRFFRDVFLNLFTSGLFLKDKPPMDISSQVTSENTVLSVSALFVILSSPWGYCLWAGRYLRLG